VRHSTRREGAQLPLAEASFRNIDNVFHKFKVSYRNGQRLAGAIGLYRHNYRARARERLDQHLANKLRFLTSLCDSMRNRSICLLT